MKRRPLVSQGTLGRLLNSAEEARKRFDFEGCIEILERANKLDPANTDILLNLGHSHGITYDYAAADQCFERAVRIASNKASVLSAAGLRAHTFGNYAMAQRYYQLAAAHKDISPDALVALAEIHERFSRLEAATELTDRALRLKNDFGPALLVRARLERQAGRLEVAETILRAISIHTDHDLRARICYELGNILDRQKRYDEAMAVFLEAKTLLRPNASRFIQERTVTRARLTQLRENLTPEILQRWFDAKSELQPGREISVLCGHPRSGTTLLEQVLDSHPNAISAEETNIFHNDAYLPLYRGLPDGTPMLSFLESAKIETLLKCRGSYFGAIESFLQTPIENRTLIDKNPSLTYLMSAVIRIFPEAKFLVALRDPRDVCLSCFMQPFAPVGQTSSAYLSMGDTIDEYAELMAMCGTITSQMRNPCLEVRYEDMVEDLEAVAKRALSFLGLTWDERVLKFDEHARQKAVRSPTFADVTQPVFKRAVGRWRNYQRYLDPHLVKLEPFLKKLGYQ